jgi:hypothetical protein
MIESQSDLLIRIRPQDGRRDGYPVEVKFGDGAVFMGSELRLDPIRLAQTSLDTEAYGLALFDALFADGNMRAVYARAFGQSPDRVRCRLQIDDARGDYLQPPAHRGRACRAPAIGPGHR